MAFQLSPKCYPPLLITMKLRSRKIDTAKNEPVKAIVKIERISEMEIFRVGKANNHDDTDLQVKQEEEDIKPGLLLSKAAENCFKLTKKDYFYYCDVCNDTTDDILSLVDHYKTVHNHELGTSIKHVGLEPDVHDFMNYCRSCEIRYLTTITYRRHLKGVHHMMLRPLRYIKQDDKAEKVEPKRLDEHNISCDICNIKLNSELSFQYHLLASHPSSQNTNQDGIQPDVNDPNFFCRVCKRESASVVAYRQHLRAKHKMILQPLWMTLYDPKYLPDPLDPNFFCRVCKTSENSLSEHRNHCRSQHRMTLNAVLPFAFPDAAIDVDSPDFYCAKCNKRLKSLLTFNSHIRRVHNIPLMLDQNQ